MTETRRDEDGTPIAVQAIRVRNKTSDVLLDLKIVRNELLDLIGQFESLVLLTRECPSLSDVQAWRSVTGEKLSQLGERLLKIGGEYQGVEEVAPDA